MMICQWRDVIGIEIYRRLQIKRARFSFDRPAPERASALMVGIGRVRRFIAPAVRDIAQNDRCGIRENANKRQHGIVHAAIELLQREDETGPSALITCAVSGVVRPMPSWNA